MAPVRTELVGRERELAVLTDSLEAALDGHPQVVLCLGEPGIGKTRLAEELCRSVGTRDVSAVWGRALGAAGATPYWPWRQVLRAANALVDLTTIAGEHRLTTDLAPLAPELFAGDVQVAGRTASSEDRFRLFDAVGRLLRQVSVRRPLVIVLDDMHWADDPTLMLLQHLARTLTDERLLIVANHRDSDNGPGALVGGLLGEPGTRQLNVRGLAPASVGEQLAAVVGHEMVAAEIERVHSVTGGNPFFITELGRVLAEREAGASRPLVAASVRDVITSRLDRLSPDCVRLLRAGSIIGEEFPLAVVAATVHSPVLSCLQWLDEAAAAGLTEPVSTPAKQRFSHALVRDAIEAGLGSADRVALHRSAAEAVEEVYAGRLEAHVFDLARYWAVAAVLGESARAAGWIERAGAEAMRRHAYEEGARLFRLTLDVGGGELDQAVRCRVVLSLGGALYLSSDLPGGLEACLEAAALAAEIGRPDIVAQAALVAEPTFHPETDRVIRHLCENAITPMVSEPAALRARVMAKYAQVCDYLADVESAEPASEEALALAELSGDPGAMISAVHARQIVRSGPDGLEERASLAERLLALARDAADPNEQLWGHLWRVDVAFERGDFGQVARELEHVTRLAQEVGGPLARWQLLRCRAMLAQAQARFGDARRLADEAFAAVAPTGHPAAALIRGALLSAVGHHAGYDADSLAANGIPDPGSPLTPFQTAGVIGSLAASEILTEIGRLPEAASIYRSLGAVGDWPISPHSTLATYKCGICVAAALDAADDLATLRDLLGPYRGHHVISGAGPLGYFGPAELWLGMAAAHLDLLDDAAVDLEYAVKVTSANGAVGFEAEAQYELAAVLARRARAGDAARARSLAVDSARQATALDMHPIRAKAARLVERLDHESATTLTPREREVAQLVAQGLTNRQIAARLYLSERTAENHVQHILTKLDLANRSQIAMWISARR